MERDGKHEKFEWKSTLKILEGIASLKSDRRRLAIGKAE
jgi:hypothetical protein